MTEQDLLPGFRQALVDAGHRANRRRYKRRAAVRRTAAAVVVLVITLSGAAFYAVTDESPASADVVVTRVGDTWQVHVTSQAATARQVEEHLQDSGINALVETVPVGPSRVGEFVSGDANVRLVGEDPQSSSVVEIPVDAPIARLHFGRPAESHERYETFSDAFAAREPLECTDLDGLPARVALREITALVNDVSVVDAAGREIQINDVADSHIVTEVLMLSPMRARATVVHSTRSTRSTTHGTTRCPNN